MCLMLFQEEHIRQIRNGEKTVTRRDWESPQVKEGGVYIASTEMFCSHEEADCYIRVLHVNKEELCALTPSEAEREGGYSMEEFRELWAELHGRWEPAKEITRVVFEYVGREHPDHQQQQSLAEVGN